MEERSGNPRTASLPDLDSRVQEEARPAPAWMNAALAGVVLLIYAVLPTKNYYWDGISFAQNIEQAGGLKSPDFWTNLIHPNHLIYNFVGYLAWISVRGLGFHVRALSVLQAINMVSAAASTWLLQRTLLRITRSMYLSTALTAVFAFSAIFWKYATDANAYVPSVLFLIAAFYALISGSRRRPLLVGLLHVCAMLIHQLAVLFFPAAALGVFLRGGWRDLWRYCLVAAGITLPAYFTGFWLQRHETSLLAFVRWLTGHSPDVSFSFNVPRNFATTIESYTRLYFGGTGRLLQFFGPFMLVTLVLLAMTLVTLIVAVVRYRADLRLMQWPRGESDSLRVSWMWLAAYVVFLFFWLPGNTFYKLFCLPAIMFIAGQWLAQYRGPRRNRLALLAATIALANLALFIYPYSRPEYNQSLRFATRMQPLWSDRTVVYYSTFTVDNWFIRYFNPETTWKPVDPKDVATTFPESARRDVENGQEVWLDASAADTLAGSGFAATHFETSQEDNYPKHPIRFFRWNPH
jgi:hypothetical protein